MENISWNPARQLDKSCTWSYKQPINHTNCLQMTNNAVTDGCRKLPVSSGGGGGNIHILKTMPRRTPFPLWQAANAIRFNTQNSIQSIYYTYYPIWVKSNLHHVFQTFVEKMWVNIYLADWHFSKWYKHVFGIKQVQLWQYTIIIININICDVHIFQHESDTYMHPNWKSKYVYKFTHGNICKKAYSALGKIYGRRYFVMWPSCQSLSSMCILKWFWLYSIFCLDKNLKLKASDGSLYLLSVLQFLSEY